MATIKSFKGILYGTDKAHISKVVAPPYDVISEDMQKSFYKMSPYNIIRLILGREEKSDTNKSNKYTRAKSFLEKWLKEKVLVKDSKDSIYVYEQDYLDHGRKKTRIGFIAAMKIEDPKRSGILPHEYTLAKPKKDRLNLIKRTKTNLSPIFSLFVDDKGKINSILKHCTRSKKPLFTVDTEGVMHKLWRIDDRKSIQLITSSMKSKKVFIADGHHRYEVALNYRNKMRKSKDFKKSMDYVMMYFSDLKEKNNLTILSTHRVLKNLNKLNKKKFLTELKKYFDVIKQKNLEKCFASLRKRPKSKGVFGMYIKGEGFYLLSLKRKFSPSKIIKSKKTKALKELDVTILHDLIVDGILGIQHIEGNVKYVRDESDAVRLVNNGDYEFAFFLRPTDVMEMKVIAEKGEMMPQKSTYFYPKLLTGLVVNKF